MRINLDCPYEEKNEAKALGARWDAARKTWYIENKEDLTPFMRWLPAKKDSGKGVPVTVSKSDHECDCMHVLPWEHCEHSLSRESNSVVATNS